MDDLEFHAWPYRKQGGQHVRQECGVLVVHKETGIAVVAESKRSQMGNKVLAVARVRELVAATDVQSDAWRDVHEEPQEPAKVVHLAAHQSTKCGLLNMSNLEIRFDKEGFENDPERCKNCCRVVGCQSPP